MTPYRPHLTPIENTLKISKHLRLCSLWVPWKNILHEIYERLICCGYFYGGNYECFEDDCHSSAQSHDKATFDIITSSGSRLWPR